MATIIQSLNFLDGKEIFAFGDLHGDIHALRLLLDLTGLTETFTDSKWKDLYDAVFNESDLGLNYLLTPGQTIYNIIEKWSKETIELFPKWKTGEIDKVIIVTGDMVDNLRHGYTAKKAGENCHIGSVKQEELKIVLCLKILDYQALKANNGCRVITLLGNHEDMNVNRRHFNPNYFCQDDEYYCFNVSTPTPKYITRTDFFKIYHRIFNFEDGYKKIIFRVNNNVFMHGGMTNEILNIFRNKFNSDNENIFIDNFIIIINHYYNNFIIQHYQLYSNTNDVLWDRTFGEPFDKPPNETCEEFNAMIANFTEKDSLNLIVGHCVQSYIMYDHSSLKSKKLLRYFHPTITRTRDKHVVSGDTEEKNILDSFELISEHIIRPNFPSFIGINTTKCGTNDRIFRLDVGMSKAFDDNIFYEEFQKLYSIKTPGLIQTDPDSNPDSNPDPDVYSTQDFNDLILYGEMASYMKLQFFLLTKYVLSRAPQLLHLNITNKSKVIRASLTNTLKYMSRDNTKLIPTKENAESKFKFVCFMATVAYIDNTEIDENEFE